MALTDNSDRLPNLLCDRYLHCPPHDLQGRTCVWKEEPSGLHLGLLDYRLYLSHVDQGFRHCAQVDPWW